MRVRLYDPAVAAVHGPPGGRPGLASREGICYKTIVGPLIRATAIVLLAAALGSCQRSVAGDRKQSPSRIPPTPPAAATPAAATPLAPADKPSVPAPATPSATSPSRPASSPPSGDDFGLLALLGQGAQDGTLPEDFEIGPLAAERLLADDARAAHAAAATLLDAWVARRVERSPLAAGAREALAGTIGYALERGDVPLSWRLGPPRTQGGELVANLRLLAAGGSAEGEVYAAREGGGVLVSDLQVDPARLRVPRGRPARTFFPSPYRWLLGG